MRLIDAFPSWMTGRGIFAQLGDWTPWAEDESISPTALDIAYLGGESGYKETSPLLDKLMGFPNQIPLSDVQVQRVVDAIKAMYALDWLKMWEAIHAEYNPLENYSMVEDGNDTDSGSETLTMGKGTTTENAANIDTASNVKTVNRVVPFGGNNPVETDENESDSSTSAEEVHNYGKTIVTGEDENTTEFGKVVDRHLERSGNIGVTTSQQMLDSELELRKKHYFSIVFADLDALLTSPIWRT